MSQDWIGPLITGLVGAAGIAGTVFATYVQRRAQADSAAAQRAYEIQVRREAAKREAYVRFLDVYDELHGYSVQVRRTPAADLGRDQLLTHLQQLCRDLDVARNRLALYADLYLIYYLDQLMHNAHAEALAAERDQSHVNAHPAAIHRVYWLMRQELEDPDIMVRPPGQVLDAMHDHEARSEEILALLVEERQPEPNRNDPS